VSMSSDALDVTEERCVLIPVFKLFRGVCQSQRKLLGGIDQAHNQVARTWLVLDARRPHHHDRDELLGAVVEVERW